MKAKLGIAPIAWSNDDLPELGGETTLETCLSESKIAGFSGVETGGKFPKTSSELGPILKKHELYLASGWYSGTILDNDLEKEKDQALGQCREWLRRNLPNAELVESHSTASAVEIAAKRSEVAAIASSIAAELNDVPIVQKGIQDNSENVTRFLVIGKTEVRPLGDSHDKTSLVISLKDQSGALEKALMPFAKRRINLIYLRLFFQIFQAQSLTTRKRKQIERRLKYNYKCRYKKGQQVI